MRRTSRSTWPDTMAFRFAGLPSLNVNRMLAKMYWSRWKEMLKFAAANKFMNQAGSGRKLHIDKISAVALLVVLALSVAAGLTPFGPHLHLGCVVVVAAYASYAVRVSLKNPARSARLGETTYLLGYIGTICGLGAIGIQIGEHPELLTNKGIPQVLFRGAIALLSSVIGLIGMNLVKLQEDKIEEPREEIEEMISRLLPAFKNQLESALQVTETNRFQSFLEGFKAPGLAENMASMAASLKEGAASIALLKTASIEAKESMKVLGEQMAAVSGAAKTFCEATQQISPVWKEMTSSVNEAAQLGVTVNQTTAALAGFQEAAGGAQGVMQQHVTMLGTLQSEITAVLLELRAKLEGTGKLADSVGRFVELANKVAPTLETLGHTFADVSQINQNVKELVVNMRQLNGELITTRAATGDISANAREMTNSTGTLVMHIGNKIHDFELIADRMGTVAEAFDQMGPVIHRLKDNLQAAEGFSGAVSTLVEGMGELRNQLAATTTNLESTTTKMDEAKAVVDDFVTVTGKVFRATE